MTNILLGLAFFAGGIAIIRFSQQLVEFGRVPWAELNLGSTRNMYILVGFGGIVLGMLFIFGIVEMSNNPAMTEGEAWGTQATQTAPMTQ